MERKDVMSKNVSIYKAQAAALEKHGSKNAKVRAGRVRRRPGVIVRGTSPSPGAPRAPPPPHPPQPAPPRPAGAGMRGSRRSSPLIPIDTTRSHADPGGGQPR